MTMSRAVCVVGLFALCTLTGAGCATHQYGAPTAKVTIESDPPDADLWIIPHDSWIAHTKNHIIVQSDPWLATFRKGRTNKELSLPKTEQVALTFDRNGNAVTQLFRPGADAVVTLDLQ